MLEAMLRNSHTASVLTVARSRDIYEQACQVGSESRCGMCPNIYSAFRSEADARQRSSKPAPGTLTASRGRHVPLGVRPIASRFQVSQALIVDVLATARGGRFVPTRASQGGTPSRRSVLDRPRTMAHAAARHGSPVRSMACMTRTR